MAGDVVGGWLSDMILKRTGNAKLARRGVAAPGFLLAGAFVLPAAMVEDATISILFLATSFFFLEWGSARRGLCRWTSAVVSAAP